MNIVIAIGLILAVTFTICTFTFVFIQNQKPKIRTYSEIMEDITQLTKESTEISSKKLNLAEKYSYCKNIDTSYRRNTSSIDCDRVSSEWLLLDSQESEISSKTDKAYEEIELLNSGN